jgi:hypothetical protein
MALSSECCRPRRRGTTRQGTTLRTFASATRAVGAPCSTQCRGTADRTYLLNQVSVQTTPATKAARYRIAAADRIDLVNFAFRRTQGIEAGLIAARCAGNVVRTARIRHREPRHGSGDPTVPAPREKPGCQVRPRG